MDTKFSSSSTYDNYVLTRYYTICAIVQTIWSIAVLGFTAFMVLYFKNYWVLFSLVLIFFKPYRLLEVVTKSDIINRPDRKSYGTNNPPNN